MTCRFPLRTAKKEKTRAHIVDTASRLFHLNGFEAVSLRDIASTANLSTGAIFGIWPNKEALFAEAMGRPHLTDARGAELLEHLKAIAPGAADELLNRWAA